MKVRELIAELQKCNPDHEVVIRGYEEGVNAVHTLEHGFIARDVYDQWYFGQHSFLEDTDDPSLLTPEERRAKKESAVQLMGWNELVLRGEKKKV